MIYRRLSTQLNPLQPAVLEIGRCEAFTNGKQEKSSHDDSSRRI